MEVKGFKSQTVLYRIIRYLKVCVFDDQVGTGVGQHRTEAYDSERDTFTGPRGVGLHAEGHVGELQGVRVEYTSQRHEQITWCV